MNKSSKLNESKTIVIFVDDMDGDVYLNYSDALEATAHALDHGANKVVLERITELGVKRNDA